VTEENFHVTIASLMIFYHSFHNRYEPTISVGCLVTSNQGSLCFLCDFIGFVTW